MRKAFKVLGIALAFLVVAVLILEIAGYRFIYKNMLYGDSSNVIVKDEWVFDYFNHFTITNDQGEVSNDYISHVLPIRKYGFLYKRVEYDEKVPTFQVYTTDGEEFVGVLYRFEGREVDHYFFCRGSVINLGKH